MVWNICVRPAEMMQVPNSIEGWSHTPPKTSMTGWKIHHLKMYFLLNMGIFQLVMLVFRGVYVFLFKNYHPLPHGQHWTPCSALDETRHCSREFSLKPQFFGYLKRGIIWFGKGIQSQWKRWMDVPESKNSSVWVGTPSYNTAIFHDPWSKT